MKMNHNAIEDKIKDFFENVDANYLVKELEEMGHEFEPIEKSKSPIKEINIKETNNYGNV